MGDAEGSQEQKSTFVDNPFGLTLPLRTALVWVMLMADKVCAVGAGARTTGTKPMLRKNRSSTDIFLVVFMLSNPPLVVNSPHFP